MAVLEVASRSREDGLLLRSGTPGFGKAEGDWRSITAEDTRATLVRDSRAKVLVHRL